MSNENMDADYHNDKGVRLFELNSYNQAIEEFTMALQLPPLLDKSADEQIQFKIDVLCNRANTYIAANRTHFFNLEYYQAAVNDYEEMIALSKDNEDIGEWFFEIARIKFIELKFDEAKNYLNKAIDLNNSRIRKYQNVLIAMFRDILGGYFSERNDIIEFPMPSTVKNIGKEAFSLCENLKKIVLPDGVVSIGERAFYGCKALEEIKIPGTLKEITLGVFQNCFNLKQIEIENGVELIGEDAFHSGSYENVILPDSVKKVKSGSFFSNTVKSIKIGSNVSLDKDAFCYNFALDYKLQGKEAGAYVLKPEGIIKEINGEQIELNWVYEN